jgi:hypothetical protein
MGLTLTDKQFKAVSGLNFLTYDDGTYEYFCFANAGTAPNKPFWKIMRITKADDTITWCDGNDNYDNLATDQSVVSGLDYS